MSTVDSLYAISTNPLVLLFVGAGMSGILVPYFTRRWQDRQEELKLKRDLILELSNAVTKILRAVQLTEVKTKKPDEFDSSKEEWFKATPNIGAQIHTYFYKSKRKIRDFWDNYKQVINQYCDLIRQEDIEKRQESLNEISQNLRKITQLKLEHNGKGNDNFDSLVDALKKLLIRSDIKSEIVYGKEWHELHQKMFDLKHDLMKLILESSIDGFSGGLFNSFRRG
jgi:hypothetical protein